MHPLSGTVPLPYAPVRVTSGALVTHRHSLAPPRCRTFQYRRTLCSSRCLFKIGTILVTMCLMVWNWWVLRAGPIRSCWPILLVLFCLLLCSFFLPLLCWLGGVGVFRLIECSQSIPALQFWLIYNTSNSNSNSSKTGRSTHFQQPIARTDLSAHL